MLTSARFGAEKERVLLVETAMKTLGWIWRGGRSIQSVARETGISRTTVQKYLKNPEQPRYLNRPLFVGDPEVGMPGYGKEQMWEQMFT